MRTDVFHLTGDDAQREVIINAVEEYGQFTGLDEKSVLRLRLLTEELLGIIPELIRYTECDLYAENEGSVYRVHATIRTRDSGFFTREKILSIASSGKNEAEKGFMSKIRSAVEMMLYPSEEEIASSDFICYGCDAGVSYHDNWSLQRYVASVRSDNREDGEAWDELEKSIVARLADNVTVSIRGKQVEVELIKDFA